MLPPVRMERALSQDAQAVWKESSSSAGRRRPLFIRISVQPLDRRGMPGERE
jgi:hypothetical protein